MNIFLTAIRQHMPVLLLLLLLAPCSAWALTDAEYSLFMQRSPAFAAAEKDLDAAWKTARQRLPKEEFAALRNDQQAWLARGRARAAHTYVAEKKLPLPEAYALVTAERTALIQNLLTGDGRRPRTLTGMFSFGTGEGAAVIFEAVEDSAPGTPEMFSFASSQANNDKVFPVCGNGDICAVTGIMNIDGDYFVTVSHVTVSKKAAAPR